MRKVDMRKHHSNSYSVFMISRKPEIWFQARCESLGLSSDEHKTALEAVDELKKMMDKFLDIKKGKEKCQ